MIHPWRIFLVFLSVAAILVGVILIFPSGEIKVTEKLTLRFFPKEALTDLVPAEKVDISQIIEKQGEVEGDTAREVQIDTTKTDSLNIKPADVIITKYKIRYPEGKADALHNFFHALDEVRGGGRLVRIFHYGDSQIEGDRITADLRTKFQLNENFGGCGPGIIPVRDVLQGRLSIRQQQSGDWIKYAVYQENPQDPPHNLYSLLGSFFRYQLFPEEDEEQYDGMRVADTTWEGDSMVIERRLPKPILDSLEAIRDSILAAQAESAWFRVRQSNMGKQNTRSFENYKLLYGMCPPGVIWKTVVNDNDTIVDQLPESNGFTMLQRPFNANFGSLGFHFEGRQSPDIYGVALDCNTGIAVDNLAMRGSAVTNFTAITSTHLTDQVRKMNGQLVILQFGVNVVPYVTDNYDYYENMMYRQIKALQHAVPGISVLVVGVSDMAHKEGTGYASYPNIELIRKAQKNAAFRAGVAFWDLYEAMGGKNSMVSWVQNDPAYAENDYTHFNPRGSRIIGKMIYDAIMEEYYVYKEVINP